MYHYYRESDTVEYHVLNGAWFRVEVALADDVRKERVGGFYAVSRGWEEFAPDHRWVTKKRACSKKEIRDLDLDNRTETRAPSMSA